MKCAGWPVGICNWSLQTDVDGVAEAMKQLGIDHVNLTVRPALSENGSGYLAAVREQNWTISAMTIGFPQEDYSTLQSIKTTGGIVPDECWEQNRKSFFDAIEVTAELQVGYLSMHAGFIEQSDAAHAKKLRDRIVCLADAARAERITLLMETGQETAESLRQFLEELNHPALGVNLDPANMILYDKGDPVEAVRTLGPWIKHIHIKDAIRTKQPGTWGTEVPWGEGEVGGDVFLQALKGIGFAGVLAIEREAGEDRFGDIKLAAERLSAFKA